MKLKLILLVACLLTGCGTFKKSEPLNLEGNDVQRVVVNPLLLEEPDVLPLIEGTDVTLEQLVQQKQKETKAFYNVRQQALGLIEFVCKAFPDSCERK